MAYLSKITIPDGTTYDLKDEDARTSLEDKQEQTTAIASTLFASSWESNVYSFTASYPSSDYNLMIELDGNTLTSEQYSAWNKAQIVGVSNSNIIKAFGIVPAIDIPIQLYIIPK